MKNWTIEGKSSCMKEHRYDNMKSGFGKWKITKNKNTNNKKKTEQMKESQFI